MKEVEEEVEKKVEVKQESSTSHIFLSSMHLGKVHVCIKSRE